MPFQTATYYTLFNYGYDPTDYGTCDGSGNCTSKIGKAVWWPQFSGISNPPCASAGTCVVAPSDVFNLQTILDFTSVNKQAILNKSITSFVSGNPNTMMPACGVNIFITMDTLGIIEQVIYIIKRFNYMRYSTYTFDNPFVSIQYYLDKVPYWVVYANPTLGKLIYVQAHGCFAWWSSAYVFASYSYESSPELVMPLDYNNDYLKYTDLRRTIGFQSIGRHPGWNASDIISIARDVFPNRVWMVYDDIDSTLYGYGVTLEDLPEWVIDVFNPSRFIVLRDKWDSEAVQRYISQLAERLYVKERL